MKWLKRLLRLLIAVLIAFHMQLFNVLDDNTVYVFADVEDASVIVTARGAVGVVGPPSNLVLTDLGLITVEATWSVGSNATYTMLRGARDHIPDSITDGELIYYDTGSSCNITAAILQASFEDINISAWSFGADNITQSGYISASLYGEPVEEVAEALTEGLGGLTSLTNSIGTIGVALGIIGYLLPVIILSILAFWKENPVLFMLAFGFSWITGLYAPNILNGNSETTVLGITLGLMIIGYSLFCAVMAFRLMFWEGRE